MTTVWKSSSGSSALLQEASLKSTATLESLSLDGAAVGCGKLQRRIKLCNCLVLQCETCKAVVGDTLAVCGEDKELVVLVCTKVTKDVMMKDCLFGTEGNLEGCFYSPLHCNSCSTCLGFSLYSTPPQFAHLRELFCLYKKNIHCYSLKTRSVLPATDLNFDLSKISNSLKKIPAASISEEPSKAAHAVTGQQKRRENGLVSLQFKNQLLVVHMTLTAAEKKLEEISWMKTQGSSSMDTYTIQEGLHLTAAEKKLEEIFWMKTQGSSSMDTYTIQEGFCTTSLSSALTYE
ncbi:protein Mis18-beta isoform X1 [Latimeria chalumnae]|uniref:protein Mis18-beta isoform X1 n=1 Tax=Latimeria chalumnae TaxID=7897 RepID=UPI0003C152BC|nr:PREDICTED: protein Mis18-beta isoform X1 [Latimeria chalumnae]|eukprot:XP_006001616.1 PREDICTED: protein Mis18-beta isoform X1 [Latimeria chalumnae]